MQSTVPARRSAVATLAAVAFAVLALLALVHPTPVLGAPAERGGLSAFAGGAETVPGSVATLSRGRAIPPADAPPAVKQVIRAANRIRATPYVWGGGHGSWWSRGYDCSGAVSFALHGGRLLAGPLVSGSMMRLGAPGPGRWITVYANAGHAFATIAGLRWDTAGNPPGVSGPRWHLAPASHRGFAVRHPIGF